MPQLAVSPSCEVARPMTTTPPKAIAQPVRRVRGKPSWSSHPASRAIRIGPTFTSIAAVPASTRRSASFSATL